MDPEETPTVEFFHCPRTRLGAADRCVTHASRLCELNSCSTISIRFVTIIVGLHFIYFFYSHLLNTHNVCNILSVLCNRFLSSASALAKAVNMAGTKIVS